MESKKITGSIQPKNGYWHMVIGVKDDSGKFKYKWQSTGLPIRGNKKAATRMLDEKLALVRANQLEKDQLLEKRLAPRRDVLGSRDMPFVQYLEKYIEFNKENVSDYVYFTYSYYIKVFKEFFQDLTLIEITDKEIDDFFDYARSERGVNNTTIVHYADVLRPALRKAFLDKVIPDNPFDRIKLPKREKKVTQYYNKDEIEIFFEKAKTHRFILAYKVLAYYGFRRSELIGLKWDAIDFEHGTISINHKVIYFDKRFEASDELKTESSRRTLPLIANIREELLLRKQWIEKNQFIFGNAYNNKWKDYIFVDEKGDLYKPDTLSKNFEKIIEKKRLKGIRLHDLRHSCASLLSANGISLKQIQEWLGHANFLTTANIYTHLDFSTKIQSANAIANALTPQPQQNKSGENSLDSIKDLLREMGEAGFDDVNEYLKHLENQLQKTAEIIPQTKKREDYEI